MSSFVEPPNLSEKCPCTAGKMFPHRRLKCTGRLLAPGMLVKNDTDHPILFVLSQISPLHWDRVEPHDTRQINCGRVLFTASAEFYNPATEPTALGVAVRLATMTVTTVFIPVVGVIAVGAALGVTSAKGARLDGILADGKLITVTQQITDGLCELKLNYTS